MTTSDPPDLDGWQAWCEICAAYHQLTRTNERDQLNEAYYTPSSSARAIGSSGL